MKCEDLYRGIGGIDEKWIALAEEPEQRKEPPHFIGYELKKLFGIRYIWIFLAVFLLLNSILAYFTASRTEAAQISAESVMQFLDEYKENPERYDVYHQQENANDALLFQMVYSIMNAEMEHERKLDTVIANAERNLNDFTSMGINPNAYAYQYQLRIIEEYTHIQNEVILEAEYTYGWNEYFSYELVNVFIFLTILVIGSVLFLHEKQSGFLSIIRAVKYGRARTAVAKILTLLLLTAFVVLLFVLSTWAVYGIVIGYSSPSVELQTLELFTLSANDMTVGTYFFLNILMKFLSVSLFAMAILAFSILLGNYILVYAAGISFLGCNLFLYLFPWLSAEHPLRHLNLTAISVGTPIFNRFRSINLFGTVAEYVSILIVFFVICFAVLFLFCVFRYAKCGVSSVYPEWLAVAVSWVLERLANIKKLFSYRKKEKTYHVRRFSMSLIGAEIYKTLISSKLIFVLLLLLCVKIWYTVDVNTEKISYAHQFYAEYMTILEGEITEEKEAYLQNERDKITETLAVKDAMDSAYANAEITWAEYSAYREDYAYAISRDKPLAKAEEQAAYLMRLESESGVKGWFFYDYGWEKLYTGDADLFLYMCILILLTGTFASEYLSANTGGAMIHLLRTMKKGRRHTFGAKLISSSVIAFLLALAFNLIDCIVVFAQFDMPAMSAPLASMPIFEKVSASVTVGGYLILFLVLRIFAALVMAMLVCALSEILCKYVPILGTVVILTLLPAVCVYFGITAAQKINFLNLFAVTPLVLTSAEYAWLGSGWTMLAVWISLIGVMTTLLLSVAKRMFVK
ncbi:MAG: hypothetical protein IJ489_11095 [Clostridia bacterium]|nr:hypothetical protein [Clostridia bacterium]